MKKERIKLGEVATYINGFAFKPQDRGEKGLPIIRIQDLTGNGCDLGFYDGKYPEKIEINNGDVLISWSASLGVYIWNRGKALLNQHIFKVCFDKAPIDKKYFVYAVQYKLSEMGQKTHGATMKHIVKKDFEETVIPYPLMQNQIEIVKKLDKAYNGIALRKKELLLLDTLIKARFVEVFGDPVTNPYRWNVVSFNDCLESIENGKSFVCDGEERVNEKPAILKLSAVTYGVYKPGENKAIINEEDFIESAEVHVGDLLFTRKNTPELVGMAAYVESTPIKLMMPDLIFRLNTKNQCNKIFLWKLINHDLYRKQIESAANGSAKSMSNISKERLGKLRFPLPPMELQNQFADFVNQVNKSKVAVQKALDEAQLLFDSLMQEYFG